MRHLVAAGAYAIKVLLHHNPADSLRTNRIKQVFVERVGAECVGIDVPFFLEIVTYDDQLGDERGLAFAKAKPSYVTQAIAEFTQPRYGIDVLKVEVPVNLSFVAGTRAFGGTAAYSYRDALRLFQEAASAATRPFIYLSAGVTDAVFRETLELAGEAGVGFAGVLCGRATWQDGILAYARGGIEGLRSWLEGRGTENVTALNMLLAKVTVPWWMAYGGKDHIDVVDP